MTRKRIHISIGVAVVFLLSAFIALKIFCDAPTYNENDTKMIGKILEDEKVKNEHSTIIEVVSDIEKLYETEYLPDFAGVYIESDKVFVYLKEGDLFQNQLIQSIDEKYSVEIISSAYSYSELIKIQNTLSIELLQFKEVKDVIANQSQPIIDIYITNETDELDGKIRSLGYSDVVNYLIISIDKDN